MSGSGRRSDGFRRALAAVQRALDRAPAPSAIIGGVAVAARGIARFTEDIDATIAAAELDLGGLVEVFRSQRIAPRIRDWRSFVQRAQVLLLVHEPTGVEIDVSMAWLPFELDAIADASRVRLGSVAIRAVTPTALAIYKLIAHRPVDLMDVERLLLLREVEVPAVRRVLASLSEHLEGPDRLATLEQLLARRPPSARRPRATRPARRGRRRS